MRLGAGFSALVVLTATMVLIRWLSRLIAWAVGGVDAVEILLLTEQWWVCRLGCIRLHVVGPTRTWTRAWLGCSVVA